MRTLTLVLTIAILVLGVHALAQGDEASDDQAVAELQKQVKKLTAQVEYLTAREADVTTFLVASEARGTALQSMVVRMVRQGYTNRAVPAESRETLMAGLKALGVSLVTDLPVVTDEQAALLKAIERIK